VELSPVRLPGLRLERDGSALGIQFHAGGNLDPEADPLVVDLRAAAKWMG
jgi:hypothetical protein